MAAEQDWLARVLSRWEDLFDEVDWEEIPLELVERMVIYMKDGRVIDLNIKQMAKDYNLNYDTFEAALEMRLDEIETSLDHVDWHLDTGKAVRVIESATNQILKDI